MTIQRAFRHAPTDPQVDAGFRADKRHIGRAVLHDGGGDVDVNMIVVIVGREDPRQSGR